MVLKDGAIRVALAAYLASRSPRPGALVHELRVSRGNAIADLVALYKTPHCFEIKGHTDSVRRVLRQAEFYNRAFKRLTLVTTANHRAWAERHLPDFWGLVIAVADGEVVRFRHIRSAKLSPHFDSLASLAPLWRDELAAIADALMPGWTRNSHTRTDLARQICAECSSGEVANFLVKALASRQSAKRSGDESDMRISHGLRP